MTAPSYNESSSAWSLSVKHVTKATVKPAFAAGVVTPAVDVFV